MLPFSYQTTTTTNKVSWEMYVKEIGGEEIKTSKREEKVGQRLK